ncbi:MAG: PD40 domain-containing protein [Phycisphaeraceae bacterium]|nr:PD40 domain-containing protein [Phycisphaeraceae bacterium]
MPENLIKVPWPRLGLDESGAYRDQPDLTTPDALNVGPFDVGNNRDRGGQRPGTVKGFAISVNGTNQIQRMLQANKTSLPVAFGDKLAAPAQAPEIYPILLAATHDGYLAVGSSNYAAPTYGLVAYDVAGESFGARSLPSVPPPGVIHALILSPDGHWIAALHGTSPYISAWAWAGGFGAKVSDPTTPLAATGPSGSKVLAWSPDGNYLVALRSTSATVYVYAWTGASFGAQSTFSVGFQPNGVSFSPSGNHIAFTSASSPYVKIYPWSSGGVGTALSNPSTLPVGASRSPAWSPDGRYLAICGTTTPFVEVYGFVSGAWGGKFVNVPSALTGGTASHVGWNVAGTALIVSYSATPYIGVWLWSDGFVSRVFDPGVLPAGTVYSTAISPVDEVLFYASPILSSPFYEVGGYEFNPTYSTKTTHLVIASGGSIYRTDSPPTSIALSTSGSDALVASLQIGAVEGPPSPLDSAPANAQRHVYFADGVTYKKLNIHTNTVAAWTHGAGLAMPVGGRMLALYRNRVMISGCVGTPHVIYAPKSGDPRDFDYAPAIINAEQAFTAALDERCTAMCPWGDDYCVIGADHSIWLMDGDISDNGTIGSLSRAVGMVGPEAWCWHPSGVLMFMGTDGLYTLAKGGEPQPVSQQRLPARLSDINYSTHRVLIAWDATYGGAWIFVTALASGASTHYFWAEDGGAFWPVQFPDVMGPTAVCLFDGDDPDDRALFLGGRDSYIYKLDPVAKNDDGAAITSRLTFSPLQTNDDTMVTFSRAVALLQKVSDNVKLRCFRGKTPEDAVLAAQAGTSPLWVASLGGGRRHVVMRPAQAAALCLQLQKTAADASWALESLSVDAEGAGQAVQSEERTT